MITGFNLLKGFERYSFITAKVHYSICLHTPSQLLDYIFQKRTIHCLNVYRARNIIICENHNCMIQISSKVFSISLSEKQRKLVLFFSKEEEIWKGGVDYSFLEDCYWQNFTEGRTVRESICHGTFCIIINSNE